MPFRPGNSSNPFWELASKTKYFLPNFGLKERNKRCRNYLSSDTVPWNSNNNKQSKLKKKKFKQVFNMWFTCYFSLTLNGFYHDNFLSFFLNYCLWLIHPLVERSLVTCSEIFSEKKENLSVSQKEICLVSHKEVIIVIMSISSIS